LSIKTFLDAINLGKVREKVSCDCDAYSKYIRTSTMVIVTYVFKREEFEFEFGV
jgi:hypothetical protein